MFGRPMQMLLVTASLQCAFSVAAAATQKRGYFISIDGLQPDYLRRYTEPTATSAKGFSWIRNGALEADRAYPIQTTITAPSHVSNITCTTPAVHGVIANNFIADGKKVSGFAAPVAAETFVEAAKRQGRSVLSIAYPSIDGQNEQRSASFGITYPDARYSGMNQTLRIDVGSLPVAQNWYTERYVNEAPQAFESKLQLVLNPATNETREVNLLWVAMGANFELYVDSDKDLSNGFHTRLFITRELSEVGDVFFIESAKNSPLFGYLRRISLRGIINAEAKVELLVFGSSYNNAHPQSFREALDRAMMVWPAKHSYYHDKDPLKYVEELAMVDRYLTSVANFAQKQYVSDIVLFYQPLIDAVGHAYEGKLPQPFDPRRSDAISQAYGAAYRIIDQNLSQLLAFASDGDAVALVGDHGMDAIKRMINVNALLEEAELTEVDIVASGALIMLYPKDNRAQAQKRALELGEKLRLKLESLAEQAGAVLGESYRKETYQPIWHWGQALWAFTSAPNVWLNSIGNERRVELEPFTWGMHGHSASYKEMATAFMIRGAGIKAQSIAPVSLLHAIPTLSKALGLEIPKQCEGKALY